MILERNNAQEVEGPTIWRGQQNPCPALPQFHPPCTQVAGTSSHLIKGCYGLGDIGTQQRPRTSVGLSLSEQGRWEAQKFGGPVKPLTGASIGPSKFGDLPPVLFAEQTAAANDGTNEVAMNLLDKQNYLIRHQRGYIWTFKFWDLPPVLLSVVFAERTMVGTKLHWTSLASKTIYHAAGGDRSSVDGWWHNIAAADATAVPPPPRWRRRCWC